MFINYSEIDLQVHLDCSQIRPLEMPRDQEEKGNVEVETVAEEKISNPNSQIRPDLKFKGIGAKQVLRVIELMRIGKIDFSKAAEKASEEFKVTPETVRDKCTRQLGIKTHEFKELVRNNPKELKQILIKKYPYIQKEIENFFSRLVK